MHAMAVMARWMGSRRGTPAQRDARLEQARPRDGVRQGMAAAGKAEWGKQSRVANVVGRWRVDTAAMGGGRGGCGRCEQMAR
jgi:hypothetical protein